MKTRGYTAILFILVFSLVAGGCKKKTGETPAVLSAQINLTTISYDSPGWFLKIETIKRWKVSIEYPQDGLTGWCGVTQEGGDGDAIVLVRASVNVEKKERHATVRVKVDGADIQIHVIQKAGPGEEPDIVVEPGGTGQGPGGNVPVVGRYELPKVEDPTWYLEYPTGDFSLEYYPEMKHSKWVAWSLNRSHQGSVGRNEAWKWDTRIPLIFRPLKSDFSSVELSRGHLCPSNDRQFSKEQNEDTFFYSNMTPQVQDGFNGGIWLDLENKERNWAAGNDKLYICAGGLLFNGKGRFTRTQLVLKYTEPSRMPVPRYNFKVILRERSGGSFDAIGFWFENKRYTGNISVNKSMVCKTVREIEELTGLDFFYNLPVATQNQVETVFRPQDWGL